METSPSADYKNRKVGLIIFGIIHIVVGVLCALICPLTILGLFIGAATDPANALPMGQALIGVGFYAFMAVWCIWLGIGSVTARRWARALILTSSWLLLGCGTCGLLSWFFIAPDIYNNLADDGQVPRSVVKIIQVVTTIFMGFVYIVWPGILIAFYGSKHTKATCEDLDSKTRWTDKCPLPVLSLSLLLAFLALSMLSLAAYNFTFPLFGVIISGIGGAALCLLTVVFAVYLAIRAYKQDIMAWWLTLASYIFFFASALYTFQFTNLIDYYRVMGFNEQQLQMMEGMSVMQGPAMSIMMLFYMVIWIAYMICIKRFFVPNQNNNQFIDPANTA